MRPVRIGASEQRLLRGYGPLVALVIAFLLMALLVPTVARERVITTGDRGSAGPADNGAATAGLASPQSIINTLTQAGTAGFSRGISGPCRDRLVQVSGDPYSPPCVAFSGDNGGATTRGVTRDTIYISSRHTGDTAIQSVLADIAGAKISDTPEEWLRTAEGMADYFNAHFQFYGRKLKVVPYDGSGSLSTELLGGGQDQANADAIKVANEVRPFADISAYTEPYADALSRQHVVSLGEVYFSKQWFEDRKPYAWSVFPDCTTTQDNVTDYANKRVFGRPARWAGGSLSGQPRKVALVTPDNPVYQQCRRSADALAMSAGNSYALDLSYTLDFANLSSQAASIVSKLKNANVTTVVVLTDPVLPVFLTAKAHEQNYFPEWVTHGSGLIQVDLFAQLYDQVEWSHAFGTTAESLDGPRRATFGYAAYKSAHPDEPAQLVEFLYRHMYMLALGIQMAGPNLTPATFEAGMQAYPGGTGPAGSWKFGSGMYTPERDAEEIWWDPNAISVSTGNPGTWKTNGRRWPIGHTPPGTQEYTP